MLPKCLLSIKAEVVIKHDLYTKTIFYEKNEIEIKCKIGLEFLSSVLPLIYIYVCSKFNFNPFCTFQDMARTSNHYENIMDNSVNIQSRIVVLVQCTFSHCHLSINQVSFQFLSYLTRYGPDRQPLCQHG